MAPQAIAKEGGHVLNFSNQSFAEFFREELGANIDDPRWSVQGGSKAKRLRYYLRHAGRKTARDTLTALWHYREATSVTQDYLDLPIVATAVGHGYFSCFAGIGNVVWCRGMHGNGQIRPLAGSP